MLLLHHFVLLLHRSVLLLHHSVLLLHHSVLLLHHFLIEGMIGYGIAKAAVHQLTKSLAQANSGLPQGATVVSILP